MRTFTFLLLMSATLTVPVTAASLAGTWRLSEVNSLPMQETPPFGQLNRKEVYTKDGRVFFAPPDAPFRGAKAIGSYQVKDNVRILTSAEGEKVSTPIHWIDDDHYFLEFNPGERWYYDRVKGAEAQDQQWEPRSVAVIRMTEDNDGPTLRDFPYDATDDRAMPWDKRLLGAWESIKYAGASVTGPDTPPYGMPNGRFLFRSDGIMRRVQANNEGEADEQLVHFTVDGNKLTLVEAGVEIHFWFNRWGQLVLEYPGMQTVMKRISLDAENAPAGPFVVVLLTSEREEPPHGKIVEVKKTAGAAAKLSATTENAPKKPRAAARPAVTFTQPYNGRAEPIDLALADDAGAFEVKHPVNVQAEANGLGHPLAVVELNQGDKYAVVRGQAIAASFQVPFGWHVVDDGQRTLVFDADHFIDLSLNSRPAPRGSKGLLNDLVAAQRAQQSNIKAELTMSDDGSGFLLMQNYQIKDAVRVRAYITRRGAKPGEVIVAEVTTGSNDTIRALNLSEAVLSHLQNL